MIINYDKEFPKRLKNATLLVYLKKNPSQYTIHLPSFCSGLRSSARSFMATDSFPVNISDFQNPGNTPKNSTRISNNFDCENI